MKQYLNEVTNLFGMAGIDTVRKANNLSKKVAKVLTDSYDCRWMSLGVDYSVGEYEIVLLTENKVFPNVLKIKHSGKTLTFHKQNQYDIVAESKQGVLYKINVDKK